MNQFTDLARRTIEAYIKEGKIIEAPKPLPKDFDAKAGVFVSLHLHGNLRGCIGTLGPTTENVAQEIIRNAIESAASDPRFSPVSSGELKDLDISVDVLSEPEPVKSKNELDPTCYGCIVKSGAKRGLLLPDLPGVTTADEQIAICRRKAGIGENEKIELFRFKVRRHH